MALKVISAPSTGLKIISTPQAKEREIPDLPVPTIEQIQKFSPDATRPSKLKIISTPEDVIYTAKAPSKEVFGGVGKAIQDLGTELTRPQQALFGGIRRIQIPTIQKEGIPSPLDIFEAARAGWTGKRPITGTELTGGKPRETSMRGIITDLLLDPLWAVGGPAKKISPALGIAAKKGIKGGKIVAETKKEMKFISDFINKYPTKQSYFDAQKGRIYKDALGREVEWSGAEHEIRNLGYYYDAVKNKAGGGGKYANMPIKELKNLRNNTPSFGVLKEVEDELIKRGKLKETSAAFMDKLGGKIIAETPLGIASKEKATPEELLAASLAAIRGAVAKGAEEEKPIAAILASIKKAKAQIIGQEPIINLPKDIPIKYVDPAMYLQSHQIERQRLKKITASLKRHGWQGAPIIIDNVGNILTGNHRVRAAINVGLDEIPTIQLDDLIDNLGLQKEAKKIYSMGLSKQGELEEIQRILPEKVIKDLGIDFDGRLGGQELLYAVSKKGQATKEDLANAVRKSIEAQQPPVRDPVNLRPYKAEAEVKKAIWEATEDFERNKNVLKNIDVLKLSKQADVLKRTVGIDETAKYAAQALATRRELLTIEKTMGKTGVTPEFINLLKRDVDAGTNIARQLQARNIEVRAFDAEDAISRHEIVKKLLGLGIEEQKIIDAAKTVDFTDLKQVTAFYRTFVKPSAKEILAELRYGNLLSSPLTHIVNATSNLLQVSGVRPATMLVSGAFDAVGASLRGTQRQHYAGQALPYYKGLLNSFPEAFASAGKALAGKSAIARPDIRMIPTGLPIMAPFQAVTRALEAGDVFFQTLAKSGEMEAALYRLAKQGKKIDEKVIASVGREVAEKAKYSIFRADLDPQNISGQGALLSKIDKYTQILQGVRRNSTVVSWYAPFVQTPMNILKQGIEYSPAGLATLKGAADKTEQLAKAAIGSMVMLGAGGLALSGRTTWAAPTGKNDKEAFYAAGRKPYALQVGNQWLSYSRLGPLAYPIAMAAALRWYFEENPKAVNQSTLEKAAKAAGGMGKFFSDQSYLQGIGSLVGAVSGEEAGIAKAIAQVPSQYVPFSSLLRWVNNILDPTFRKGERGFKGILQDIQKGIPFLSQNVPPIKDQYGRPQKKPLPIINAFSPVGISPVKQGDEAMFKVQQLLKKFEEMGKR